MKSVKIQLVKIVCSEAGDGTVEYGTLLAYSVIAIALVITIFNAAQSGLLATLTEDAAARVNWVAAKQSGSTN